MDQNPRAAEAPSEFLSAAHLSGRYPMEVNLPGDTKATLAALLGHLEHAQDRSWQNGVIEGMWNEVTKRARASAPSPSGRAPRYPRTAVAGHRPLTGAVGRAHPRPLDGHPSPTQGHRTASAAMPSRGPTRIMTAARAAGRGHVLLRNRGQHPAARSRPREPASPRARRRPARVTPHSPAPARPAGSCRSPRSGRSSPRRAPFLVVLLADHPSTYRTAGLRRGTAA
jgi:hypothetical protein